MTMELEFGNGGGRLLILDDGSLIVRFGERALPLGDRATYMPLLPLLEKDPHRIASALESQGHAVRELHSFVNELVLHALEFSSVYWKQLALSWIDELNLWNDEIEALLREICTRRSLWPQPLKRTARIILRNFDRRPK